MSRSHETSQFWYRFVIWLMSRQLCRYACQISKRLEDAKHSNEDIMNAMASQTTGVSIVCSTDGSGADQRKHQSSASLAFVRGIHRWPVNSPSKIPVTRKMFTFDDAIMVHILQVRSCDMYMRASISKTRVKSYEHKSSWISIVVQNRIFQCVGKTFCVEFQKYPVKFHTRHLTIILWKLCILFRNEELRTLRFKNS